MEQRARVMGKTSAAAVYRKYINAMKKKTKQKNEDAPSVNTSAIPNPADTLQGPINMTDRRRRKDKKPVILKRFRDYFRKGN